MAKIDPAQMSPQMGKKMPLFLFIFLITGAVIGSFLIQFNANEAANQRFKRVNQAVVLSIKNDLEQYMVAIKQAASMFMASMEVTEDEFEVYTSNMGLATEYPGLSALGFSTLSTGSTFKAPIKYFRPYHGDLKGLKNLDLMTDPSRQKAILEAASTGNPFMADAKDLFKTMKLESRVGFIIFYPVYENPRSANTPSQRLNSLKGFIFGIFNNQHLFNTILIDNNYFQKAVGIRIFLKGSTGLISAYNSSSLYGPKSHTPVLEETSDFDLAGKSWLIEVMTLPLIENSYRPTIGYYTFLFGTLLSFVVFLVANRFNKAKNAVEESAIKMKKSAEENSLLAKASATLGKSLNTEKSLIQMADFLAEHFADFCVIEFTNEDERERVVRASPKMRTEHGESKILMLNTAGDFVINQGCKTKVLEKERYVIDEQLLDGRFKSYLSLPLSIRGGLFGVVTLLCAKEKNKFKASAEYLSHLTNICAIFIENTLLYEDAQVANRLKDEFLATVSHELRTPLNVIYGHSQLLLESEIQPEYKEQIQSIYKAAQVQSTIIEDLLDVSAIISGKVQFNPRPVKVVNAIDTALDSVKVDAKNKGVELIFDEAAQCIVMGVKTRLVQIFWNLLSNAIKFTPEGGKVAIKTSVDERFCHIKFIDTGKGIEPEFLPHIFEKFKQEDKVTSRNRGGLGLGLSIVSHLVNLHGGTIKAYSEGKNKGATFTLSFPIVSLTARTTPMEEKEKLEEIERHDLHNVRVLAVDDEPESLNLIARILRSYKANVITAENGEVALKKMKTERPDVLISDIAMPEMDGYELIKEIRQKEKGQGTHIPAIALTAFAQEEDKERALSSGYEAYLSKPVNKDKLIGTVEQALH